VINLAGAYFSANKAVICAFLLQVTCLHKQTKLYNTHFKNTYEEFNYMVRKANKKDIGNIWIIVVCRSKSFNISSKRFI